VKKKISFENGEYCVYRTHGVAVVKGIQIVEIGDFKNKCLVLYLEKEKLTITVPENQIEDSIIRKICSKEEMNEIFTILRGGVRKIKGMWSRRVKEYEEKINSGKITLIAEVIRDLTREIKEVDRSFSERMIYKTAIYRLASELSILEKISIDEATDKIMMVLGISNNEESEIIKEA
jgi:CarD family transcriptional regulator